MVVIRSLALVLLLITLVLMIFYATTLSRKAKSERDKFFISRFFIILVITFTAGGITRTIQQITGDQWLNGVVPIFGGLFISLWAVPFFWRIYTDKMKGLKAFLLFLAALFFMLLGFGVIYLGVRQVGLVGFLVAFVCIRNSLHGP